MLSELHLSPRPSSQNSARDLSLRMTSAPQNDESQNLDFMINHVFFPPQLPQESDTTVSKNFALCETFTELAEQFCGNLAIDAQEHWMHATTMLRCFQESQRHSNLMVDNVENSMERLLVGGFLVFHVRSQNAGIFIHRMLNSDVSISAFEASFSNAQVMSTEARLTCIFPGPAITLPASVWDDASFRSQFANFLYHMNEDDLDNAVAHTQKAGSTVVEVRDVADPKYISELLMGILHGIGSPTPPEDFRYVNKRIGDDILWKDAYLPWRRSPVYLVLRVGLQLSLSYHDRDHFLFKNFMAFALARLLESTVRDCPELDTDLLHVMSLKVARRLHKLETRFKGCEIPRIVVSTAQNATDAARRILASRWAEIQRLQEQSPEWDPDSLDFKADTHLLLQNARPRILQGLQRSDIPSPVSHFKPKPLARLRHETDFRALTPDRLRKAFEDDKRVALADFEYIVRAHLSIWTVSNLACDDATKIVYECMEAYLSAAQKIYSKKNAEDQSHMLLALLSLWVSVDKITVCQLPLLAEYSPEISTRLLEVLLLWQNDDLDALEDIVRYISRRENNATQKDGVFTDSEHPSTFYVRYFDTSLPLQSLKVDIERDAEEKRSTCLRLLQEKNALYNKHIAKAAFLPHEHIYRYTWNRHYEDKQNCQKCRELASAEAIPKIEVNEWPLPAQDAAAKRVCFELDLPRAFEYWRAAVWSLLYDVGVPLVRSRRENAGHHGQLPGSYELKQTSSPIRLTLVTTTKSFKQSHYRNHSIPALETDVIVNCGSTWKLYDISTEYWAGDNPFALSSFEDLCTPTISEPYKALQFSLEGTTHTSNEVIAKQANCHADISLHEFVAFGSLRSGARLQWMNIAREVVTGDLTFRSEAVHALVTQAAFQVGKWENEGPLILDWHRDLSNKAFCDTLLVNLKNLMLSISSNWDNVVGLRGIILLTCRLMTGNVETAIEDQASQVLREARRIALDWVKQLVEKLSSASEDHASKLSLRVCEIAATCRGTYNGDPSCIQKLLSSSDDVATFLYCGAMVYNNTPPNLRGLSTEFCRLLDRNERLSVNVHDHLLSLITKDCSGVHRAVELLWPAYQSYEGWKNEQNSKTERWIQIKTAPSSSYGVSQQLHMDLISGLLLIEGKPVGRLPREITGHPLYTRNLGARILDVIPSDIPGMEYKSFKLVEGYEVHFCSSDRDGLIIRTRRDQEVSELIPHHHFQNDLPSSLVRDYAHWLRIPQQILELFPLDSMWSSSCSNHCISNILETPQMTIGPVASKSHVYLIDPHRRTAQMVSSQLTALEYQDEMLVCFSSFDGIVTVELPRFRSTFQLKDQLLQSKNIPGLCVDSNQSSGSMLGLRNQLVLRPVAESSTESRRVLIPYGEITIRRDFPHVAVDIRTSRTIKRAHYHEYLIDADLGYLQARDFTSRLYKVYLHAITSGRLPDPLTGRTGTEEALLEYSSASCITFLELKDADRDLLKLISALCPKRSFYPGHLKVMQTAEWHPSLSPLSQHTTFRRLTERITTYAKKLKVFPQLRGQETTLVTFDSSSLILFQRAEYRDALYHNPDLQSISDVSAQDTCHTLRSTVPAFEVSRNSRQIDLAFTEGSIDVNATLPKLFFRFYEWRDISPASEVELDLRYDSQWLSPAFGEKVLSLFDVLRKRGKTMHYSALFTFSAMVYHSPDTASLVPVFLAFAINSKFRLPDFSLPFQFSQCPHYDLHRGFEPTEELTREISAAAYDVYSAPWDARNLSQNKYEDDWSYHRRVSDDYKQQLEEVVLQLKQHYMLQWRPSSTVQTPSDRKFSRLFDIRSLHESIQILFGNWFQNQDLKRFLEELQDPLENTRRRRSSSVPQPLFTFSNPTRSAPKLYLSTRVSMINLLVDTDAPPICSQRDKSTLTTDTEELGRLLNEFLESPKPLLQLYGDHLNTSRLALGSYPLATPVTIEQHQKYRQLCYNHLNKVLDTIEKTLQPKTAAERVLLKMGHWPRLSIRALLHLLSLGFREHCPKNWQRAFTELACAIVYYQRAGRMLDFKRNNSPHYTKEVEATPLSLETAVQNLEWTLMQAESGFTLRQSQHDVLKEMISPSSAQNTTLQLNMGEGKTSVIAPLAVLTLADQKTLVRLVILKPLSRQMFHLLATRLTGLCDRRVFFLPFSRSMSLGLSEIETLQSLLQECMTAGGILIAQPEHILSFRLLTVEKLVTGHPSGPKLLEIQRWLSERGRDILDESDEILHSKYQLIYTMGQQQALQDHPDRWTTIQQILSLVPRHLSQLKYRFPADVDVGSSICDNEGGAFASLRLLNPDPAEYLVERLADDIMEGRLDNIHFGFLDAAEREAVRTFITKFDVEPKVGTVVQRRFKSSGQWDCVLLLRGLLGQRLLAYVLSKRRWRVDYGLDFSRSLLAVPYRAKDVPSPSAEFGHPDIALLLTCLSYYYRGLDKEQLLVSFQLLLNCDNVAAEYETWTAELDLPKELRRETGINLEDPTQLTEVLWPKFHRTKRVIDFYLSTVVFPKAAKEFPGKLSTSAWDLAEKSQMLKTGFSGTNDNRYLLPISIQQTDLVGQESTSAKVLSYLLQSENGPCITPNDLQVEHVNLDKLLSHISHMAKDPVRILFDVGAQILELNHDVARDWLNCDDTAQAAVFFDDKDDIRVLTRDGTTEPFISSSFRERLSECVIYLDEAHTRGTDLKFPRGARAMVTLGENAACMRLRQLGDGQSVLFFAPLEIARVIRADAKKSDEEAIQVIDILRWAMLRTCEDIEHHIPHWVQQGVDFHERDAAWTAVQKSNGVDTSALQAAWLRPEARTLEQLYMPQFDSSLSMASPNIKARQIPEMQARLKKLGIKNVGDASVDEEQEREVAQEIEQERQTERPPPAVALPHSVHRDVTRLVRTGTFSLTSSAFQPLFRIPLFQENGFPWSGRLWATKDFTLSVSQNKSSSSKEHMRPVNWLLSCRTSKIIVVLSPYEVQDLLPDIRQSTQVNLHVYAPRTRREMLAFDDLKFFCIPALPLDWNTPDLLVISQLNLFSGQLYFANFDTYRNLCAFLGVGTSFEGIRDADRPVVDSDGFVRPEARGNTIEVSEFYSRCPFVLSPIPFLKELTSLRRKGYKYLSTPWGKVLHGRILNNEDV
ncbi:hypothetical protein D9757_000321 [Collybiopsis confluens]|uniref:ubiquitinyl hydrolase 1 n=1 Tax=Collybiopsis confluens TaxID=2823264 RepID=A0A8H5MHE3_9AGAR|nr:hypothetical protein D9757_000321 [Collybiopsis confluens]